VAPLAQGRDDAEYQHACEAGRAGCGEVGNSKKNQGPVTFFNQGLIDPDQIFDRDHDRDENFSIKVRVKNFNQSLLKFFSSGSADQKLTTCALLHNPCLRQNRDRGTGFSIKVCLKNFNQCLIEKEKSMSG
jgi:hypothetical protein